jgi:predicted transcriptional regulator
MRNDLIEIEQIEKYLSNLLDKEEESQFEIRMLIDSTLYENVESQKKVHKLVRVFSRRQQKNKLELIYQQLLHEPSFSQQLKNIFA